MEIPSTGDITVSQVAAMKRRMFVAGYKAEDYEAIGVAVSQYLGFDGGLIIRAFWEALEDANFHHEAREIREKYSWAFEQ